MIQLMAEDGDLDCGDGRSTLCRGRWGRRQTRERRLCWGSEASAEKRERGQNVSWRSLADGEKGTHEAPGEGQRLFFLGWEPWGRKDSEAEGLGSRPLSWTCWG